MACRVGITTDPETRRQAWARAYPSLRNWQTLGTYRTKSAAQAAETQTAQRYGCAAAPGGAGPEYATWYVYYFEHV